MRAHPQPSVREWPMTVKTVQELERLGDVDRLLSALDEERDTVASAAARALGRLHDPRALGPLLSRAKGAHGYHRRPAAREEVIAALGTLGDARAAEPLAHQLELLWSTAQSRVRDVMEAGRARSGRHRPPTSDAVDATTLLTEAWAMADTLGQIGDEPTVPVLAGVATAARDQHDLLLAWSRDHGRDGPAADGAGAPAPDLAAAMPQVRVMLAVLADGARDAREQVANRARSMAEA